MLNKDDFREIPANVQDVNLVSDRISIRGIKYCDLPYFCKWWNNPTVMRKVHAERYTVTLEELQNKLWPDWIGVKGSNFHRFTITLNVKNNRPIGETGFDIIELSDNKTSIKTVNIHIKICEPDLWNIGLGTESIRLLIKYLIQVKKVQRIYGEPGDWNIRCLSMLRNCGFIEESRQVFKGNTYCDSGIAVRMVLNATDYH